MKAVRIQGAVSSLELLILAALVWYGRFSRPVIAGSLYLITAGYLGLISLHLATSLRKKQIRGLPEPSAWSLHRRAFVLLLSAWAVAIVGLLNLMAFTFSGSPVSIIFGYITAGLFMVPAYKMVTLSDSPRQDGGAKPLSYFGRPRSRGIFFFAFLYTPIIPLIVLSVAWSKARWCPTLLQPPQIWLLLVSLTSIVSAGMAFQRYRKAAPDKSLALKTFVIAGCGLGAVGGVQMIVVQNLNVCALSAITLGCTAATAYWLLLAREAGSPLPSGLGGTDEKYPQGDALQSSRGRR